MFQKSISRRWNIWKIISLKWVNYFYLFVKAQYFCRENSSTEELWYEFQELAHLDIYIYIYIPPNLELMLGTGS